MDQKSSIDLLIQRDRLWITLGLGTIVMTFAAEYMSHMLAAALGFAAFALLFRERQGSARLGLVAAAGLAAGLAVTVEYPLALVGAVLFFYALDGPFRLARGAWYAAGAVVGALPALLYTWWSLGSPLEFAYGDAIVRAGTSGHAEVGLNDDGLDKYRDDTSLAVLLGRTAPVIENHQQRAETLKSFISE